MQRIANRPGHFGFASDPAYLQKKLEDHRTFSAAMFILVPVLEAGLWIWDYVTDPAGAHQTILLRLSFLLFIPVALAFRHISNRRLLALLSITSILFGEVIYVEILDRLQTGMTYGIGGFMFFMLMPFVLLQAFSLRLNLSYTFAAAALPHLLAAIGFIPGFQHGHYVVLIWPAAIGVMLGQAAYAYNYLLRYESECALELASNTDPMTGTSNRRHFIPLLRQEILRCQRKNHHVSLLILDIDHFKKINDSYGHPAGDQVICKLADICRKASRQIDTVARLGGEEFAVLLPETSIQEAVVVAERIRSTVESTIMSDIGNGALRFTASIGVAEQPEEDSSEETLVSLADAALYQAKTSGRNRVVCAPGKLAPQTAA